MGDISASSSIDIYNIFIASIKSSLHVVLMCFTGYFAAKYGIINKKSQKDLSSVIIKVFMPCLLFSNVAQTDIEILANLWAIPTTFLIFVTISGSLGYIGGKLLGLSGPNTRFTCTGIIFNNVTSLLLGLLKGLGESDTIRILAWKSDESTKDIIKRGISYVLLATIWTNILRSTMITEESPLLGKEENHHPFKLENIKHFLNKIMNPPLYATLLALLVSAIPYLRSLFFSENAPLSPISLTIDSLGSVTVPLTLITLGAQLKNLPRTKGKEIFSTILYIMFNRFIIMPLIGIAIILLTRNWYINDPMLWFILIMLACGPPAVNCMNLTQFTGTFQEEMAALLFYSKYQQDYIKTIAYHNNNSINSSSHNDNSIIYSSKNNSINSSIHTSSNSLPLFNYPSFIKHLNYDRLYNSIDRWCKMERYIPDTMEVYVMRALLRLMADSGGILTTLKIHPKHSSEFRYCLIHEPEICGLFEKVKYLTHDGCCYVDYTMPLALSKICKDVKHLCLYGWNAQNFRVQSHRSGSDLTQFISQQSTLYSLNLKRCHRFTPYVLSGLSSQIKFLKYLHFEYVDFEGCGAWNDIAECKNLEVFKIAFCCNINWEMAKPVIKGKFRKLRKVVVWEVDCKELIEWAKKFNNNELGRSIKLKRKN
ncbi:6106_t:CDS:2 [Diversispora eburnea]|uniref:6106_t:CDS:1 n=1 Tax=Diversispora eburnea TaxID=1213867 RepID=A0A9N8YRH1_9GLOM|nr:6106_t:CDS:2 [Diversispora eburnea]